MTTEGKKFFMALFFALLLLIAVFFVYAWYCMKVQPKEKKPVPVCGRATQLKK
jgi:flagellar biogenesis protein FliO